MNKFEPFDFYLLRMPVYPYDRILSQLRHNKGLPSEYEGIINEPLFQEAIFLASIELYNEIQKWQNDSINERKEKLSIAIYKYLLRMATRSTPYGLFAGCALGHFSATPTNIDLHDVAIKKIYRLDTERYITLTERALLNADILQSTTFYANTSIYQVGDTYRYYEYKIVEEKRAYFLSSFSQNVFIDTILTSSRNGASFNKLAHCLIEMEVDETEASAYVKTLIENQIIVTEYAPQLTGGNQLDILIDLLKKNKLEENNLFKALINLKLILLNQQNGIIKYPLIIEILKENINDLKQKDCIQVDVFFDVANNNINNVPVKEIVSQLENLLPLNTSTRNNDLEQFKNAFYQKFEDREISLSEAIDSDLGVGYGKITGEETYYTPLIDDLIIVGKKAEHKKKWSAYHEFILNKFLEGSTSDTTQINITDEDLTLLAKDLNQENKQMVPATFAALGSIYAKSQSDFDRLDFLFLLKNCGGNSAISLVSRFGSENKKIDVALQGVVNYEKEIVSDKIFAEIIHLPEGRVSNVLVRPKIFDYEIAFLGNTSVEEQFKIPIDDLFVSIKNSQLILRSKKQNKEVLPRLTNAHNFSNGLPVYKFLCDLQFQNEGLSIAWNWGILETQPFLPRVVYKNIILKRRRWFISANKYNTKDIDKDLVIKRFQEQYKMPDLLLLVEGDNEMFLDLTNEISKSILLSKIGKLDIILYEFLNTEGSLLRDKNHQFENEIIIPIKNKGFIPVPANKSVEKYKINTDQFFTTGSEWLYLKIYAGYKSLDTILIEVIIPIVTEFVDKNKINQWFFVRYQDPESHLRIRFNTKNQDVFYELIKYIENAIYLYIKNRIVKKIEYDTFFQETEKYTPWAIDLCEYFFCIDSKTVLDIVSFIQESNDEESRWLIAIKGADALLTDFNYSIAQKKVYMEACFHSFFKEFNGDKALMLQLNNKFRANKNIINSILSNQDDLPAEIVFYLQLRSAETLKVYVELNKRLELQNADKNILNKLLNNFIHLFLNRLFVANHRLHEMVVYHHLYKHYESAFAKENYKNR